MHYSMGRILIFTYLVITIIQTYMKALNTSNFGLGIFCRACVYDDFFLHFILFI